jgi:tetratricopeptide (TPR) repeat protein
MFDFRTQVERALQQLQRGQDAEAEGTLRVLISTNPADDQLRYLLGIALLRQSKNEEAIETLRRAIAISHRRPDYHNALGGALRNTQQMEASIEAYRRALKLDPKLHDARYNLALTYLHNRQFDRADAEFGRLLAENPRDVEAIQAYANLHWMQGDYEGALQTVRQGVERLPESGNLRFSLADRLLALGSFEEGWFHYLWRINRHDFLAHIGVPFNDPSLFEPFAADLSGRTVRLHAEQGIGDDLFFLRFAPFLRERGARLVGAVAPRLVDMVSRSGVLDEVEPAKLRAPPNMDYRLLADLPFLLEAHARPLPPAVRFAPLAAKVDEVAARLQGLRRPLIGLTWRAGTGPEKGDRDALYKEVPFNKFVAMAARLPGTLLVLQRAPKEAEVERLIKECGPRVVDLSAFNGDLEGMLALLAAIDDYVGVSNTNMHLCAALGRGARVLVGRGVEFRWMTEGTASPWFPGFHVYRPNRQVDWNPAFDAVVEDLGAAYPAGADSSVNN